MTNYTIIVRNDDTGTEHETNASGDLPDGETVEHKIVIENPSLVASEGNL